MTDAAPPPAVLCAGMRRGGSTLQAQLVSALSGGARVHTTSPELLRAELAQGAARSDAPRLFKCHEFVPGVEEDVVAARVRVVYVYRDVRDVIASICRKYSIPAFSFFGEGALSLLRENRQWLGVPGVYVARYETMVADLPSEILRLGEFLGTPTNRAGAERLAAEHSVERQRSRIDEAFSAPASIVGQGTNAYDPDTLLHRNHIQSGEHGSYRSFFRRHELAALEWTCGDWLRRNEYQLECSLPERLLAAAWFALRDRLHALRSGRRRAPDS